MSVFKVDRRTLLASGIAVGAAGAGGLVLGIWYGRRKERWRKRVPPRAQALAPSVYLAVDHDDSVTIWLTKAEVGQGVYTALPTIVAEELDADWSTVRVVQAIANPNYGDQMVATSGSVRDNWMALRKAGATARAMLVRAAAEQWGVPVGECSAGQGSAVHRPTGRRVRYGALAERAATFEVPDDVPLKTPDAFTLVGRPTPRLDTPMKVDGSAVFGIDVRLSNMVYACVARCPYPGGGVSSFETKKALAIEGVVDVRQISRGVAVVATGTWAAIQGTRALEVTWTKSAPADLSTAVIEQTLTKIAAQPGAVARDDGDTMAALSSSSRQVKATYRLPYLAHATMEPINGTADVRDDRVELWAPTQHPAGAQEAAARITGIEPAKIVVNTTFVGGAFGRRVADDFMVEAIELSAALKRPVQVVWTREDDIRHDWYRPASHHEMQAGLDADGWPKAWLHRCVAPSILATDPRFKDPVDPVAVEGAQQNPYGIPALRVEFAKADFNLPIGFWRSVGHSYNAYVVECFLDEVAAAGGKDPVELRRRLLQKQPRHLGVLERAVEQAGPVKDGQFRGVAVHSSFGSYVAQVADIEMSVEGRPRVRRVVCAVDCGQVVNPNILRAQVEGGIMFGLTAALYGRIDIDSGKVVQSNFHDYPMLRIDEAPDVDVHIVDSREAPGGVGEIAVPPIAPAFANAVFAATGKPVRTLPYAS